MRTRASWVLFLGCTALAACEADPEGDPGRGGGGADVTSSGGTGGGGGAGGAGPQRSIEGVVRSYEYAFDLEAAAFRAGLAVDVAAPGGECLDLACRGEARDVTWNEAPAMSADLDGGALRACGETVPAGGALQLGASGHVERRRFHGLDVGFGSTLDLAGGQFTYLLSWVGGCDRFGPCDNNPSRLAEFHFEVAHPEGTTVLCPGALTAAPTVTRCDVAGTLAPTYSAFAIAADPLWVRAPITTAANVAIVGYEVPGGRIAASIDKESLAAYMTWITGLLGPFPYGGELRLAGAPTAWLGFEHPANILLYEGLPELATSYRDTLMHILMHEIAHQWAGDRTTIATAEDFVWKESTAEYLAYVFEDEHRPAGEAAATRAYWDSVALAANYHPRPTDDPPPSVESFYGDTYGPGPMVLYVQLEALIGRDAVLAGIASFLAEPGARRVDDLEAALEAASSADLGPYFDAWVFGSGVPEWPSFDVALAQDAGSVTVTVTQQNASGKLYGCAVEVEVAGSTRSERVTVDFGAAPASASASATIPFDQPATAYTLDPDHRVIGRDVRAARAAGPAAAPRVWIF